MKTDLAKQYKPYYTAKSKPEIVTVETAHYLSITGKGDPSAPGFAVSTQALYTTAYTLKFMSKAKELDFTVAKLEGLWCFDEALYKGISMQDAPLRIPRSDWEYRLLIRLPDFVKESDVIAAKEKVLGGKNVPEVARVGLYTMQEGLCVQMLHTGPFSKEPETLSIMLAFMQEHGFQKNGLHHEIYLSDFRKTAPEKLRTILREPVRQKV